MKPVKHWEILLTFFLLLCLLFLKSFAAYPNGDSGPVTIHASPSSTTTVGGKINLSYSPTFEGGTTLWTCAGRCGTLSTYTSLTTEFTGTEVGEASVGVNAGGITTSITINVTAATPSPSPSVTPTPTPTPTPGSGGGDNPGPSPSESPSQCPEGPEQPDLGRATYNGANNGFLVVPLIPAQITPPEPSPSPVSFVISHSIVTINSPDTRDLKGTLTVRLKSGNAADLQLIHVKTNEDGTTSEEIVALPFTTNIVEPGHLGCGIHDNHTGYEPFKALLKQPGVVTLEFAVDPEQGSIDQKCDIIIASLDLGVSRHAPISPYIGSDSPEFLSESKEDSDGAEIAINNDDDNHDDQADVLAITDQKTVNVDNDSCPLGLVTQIASSQTKGTVRLRLSRASEQFAVRIWRERFIHTYGNNGSLVISNTADVNLSPDPTNANLGIGAASAAPAEKTWDLAVPDQRADLQNIITALKTLWVEGVSSGSGTIDLTYTLDGAEVGKDTVKITVLKSRTAISSGGMTVGIAAQSTFSERDVRMLVQDSSEVVRIQDSPDDIITPYTAIPTTYVRETSSTFNTVDCSINSTATNSWDNLILYMNTKQYRVFVTKSLTSSPNGNIAGIGLSPGNRLVMDDDAGDSTFIHEWGHNLGLDHIPVSSNLMWGIPGSGNVPRNPPNNRVNQEQHDKFIP